jgi:DNA-binding IclR family transcriptional regulator
VVDFLAGELTEAPPGRLATISAPIFDAAGRVVMSVSAQPYRQLTTEQVRTIGARVMEFAQTAGSVVAQYTSAAY